MNGSQELHGKPSSASMAAILMRCIVIVVGLAMGLTACGVSIRSGDGNGADGRDGAEGMTSVVGSGKIVSKEIPVSSFSGLDVSSAFDVTVSFGDQEKLTLRVDDNVVDHVDVGVADGRLRLGVKPNTSVRNATLQASVTAKSLSGIDLSGASRVRLSGELKGRTLELKASGASKLDGTVRVDETNVDLSGASAMKLAGSAGRLAVDGSGDSDLDARQLQVRDLDINLSGSSEATVSVSGTVAAEVSGNSSLRYRGSPRFTRQETSGNSSIKPL